MRVPMVIGTRAEKLSFRLHCAKCADCVVFHLKMGSPSTREMPGNTSTRFQLVL